MKVQVLSRPPRELIMANEYIGRVNRSIEPGGASQDEVSGGLGLCVGFIANSARQLAEQPKTEEIGSQKDVELAIKSMVIRTLILAFGLDPAANDEMMAGYIGYLKSYTGVMKESLEGATSNLMLAEAVNRFGIGLQTNMNIRRLLLNEDNDRALAAYSVGQTPEQG